MSTDSAASGADASLLFQALQLGELELANRIVMAPMTRNRADAVGVPGDIMVEHYAARADAGLIVAEGAWPCAEGQGYCRQPGIVTDAQVAGWRKVVDAVHAKGGRIVLQIMHAGRIGSVHIKPAGVETLAPSAIQAQGQIFTDAAGMQPFDLPREMSADDVRAAIDAHRRAALRAREAGFDGVELHCTSGYLPMQFMYTGTNQRSDEYGGPVENRVRFAVDCLRVMAEAIGAGRVGFRVNPGNAFNDAHDADSATTHAELLRQAAALGLAYVHVMRAPVSDIDAFGMAAQHFAGHLIVNDGFDPASAEQALARGEGQAVSFARLFIGNPDLVRRLREGLPLAGFDRRTLYTAGPAGYTDYPLAD